MIFIPSTNVRVLRNVPLDNTYKDTLTFNNVDEQTMFFNSKVKVSSSDFTFQRLNNSIKMFTEPNNLYDCNYIMFQNTNFGNKWFYGFIKEVNYINENTSEIVFEMDDMQTWYFDFNVKQCFVEREHVNNDSIGAHTIPENLETGGYITTNTKNFLADELNIYMLSTETNEQPWWNEPAIVGGFPVPCYWVSLGRISDFSADVLKTILDSFASAGKADAIVSVFTAPSNMMSTQSGIRQNSFPLAVRTLSYTPKNNKLYCYPYTALCVTGLGQGIELKYELFENIPTMIVSGGFGANLQVVAIPQFYERQSECPQYAVSIKDFPICAWVTNYYQNWLAQNKASITVGTTTAVAGSLLSTVGSVATGDPLGAANGIVSGVSAVAGAVATNYEHSLIPDRMSGTANAGDIMAVAGKSGFYSYCRTIRPEYAKVIDDYFSMYGYKVNSVKVPNVMGRSSWNYVKTIDSVITGSIPVNAMANIKSMFDRGITFWHGDYVGDYSRANNIL